MSRYLHSFAKYVGNQPMTAASDASDLKKIKECLENEVIAEENKAAASIAENSAGPQRKDSETLATHIAS